MPTAAPGHNLAAGPCTVCYRDAQRALTAAYRCPSGTLSVVRGERDAVVEAANELLSSLSGVSVAVGACVQRNRCTHRGSPTDQRPRRARS